MLKKDRSRGVGDRNFLKVKAVAVRKGGYGEVAGRGPEDQKDKKDHKEHKDPNGPRDEMMWGRALSVKSAENKDDDVCDRREAGLWCLCG